MSMNKGRPTRGPAEPPMQPGKRLIMVSSLVIVAGTLTIPNVIYQTGYILGSCLIIFTGILTTITGYFIAYAADRTGGSSYEEIA